MHFSIVEGYLLGALVVLLLVAVAAAFRHEHHEKKKSGGFFTPSRFTVTPPPGTGWDSARGGEIHGGTIPGWGEDYTRPPF